MNGATATIELKLQYVPSENTSNGTPNNLIVKLTPDAPSEPVVSVLDLSFSGQNPGTMAKSLMIGGLTDWFNANLQLFTYIFATVDLNVQLDQGQYQWLAPTYTGHAYVDGATVEDAVLGILSMTQGHSASSLVAQLSAYAIPTGARSGFTISQGSFFSQMVLPGLPSAFPGAQASDFALSMDGSSVVNINKVNTQTVEHGGITYQPVVQSLNITVSGQEAVLALIALLITAVLSILTDGASFVIATIIVSLVIGFAAATPELIAAVAGGAVGSEVPSIDALVLNATSTVKWSGSSAFQVTSAGLNGCFQLGGDPCFAE